MLCLFFLIIPLSLSLYLSISFSPLHACGYCVINIKKENPRGSTTISLFNSLPPWCGPKKVTRQQWQRPKKKQQQQRRRCHPSAAAKKLPHGPMDICSSARKRRKSAAGAGQEEGESETCFTKRELVKILRKLYKNDSGMLLQRSYRSCPWPNCWTWRAGFSERASRSSSNKKGTPSPSPPLLPREGPAKKKSPSPSKIIVISSSSGSKGSSSSSSSRSRKRAPPEAAKKKKLSSPEDDVIVISL